MYAQDSIDLLTASGIDFDRLEKHGIDITYFGEILTMSGLVLNDDVKWLSFHSGYDFGYLVKALIGEELPTDESSFMDLLYIYFPCIFDIKVTLILSLYICKNAVYDDGCGGYARRTEFSRRYAQGGAPWSHASGWQ